MSAISQTVRTLPPMSEAAWLSRVLDACRLFRWRHIHHEPGMTAKGVWRTVFQGNAGFPDICAVKDGRLIVAELKTEGGVVSPEQKAWLDDLTAAGVSCFVWRPSDWPQIYELLSGGSEP